MAQQVWDSFFPRKGWRRAIEYIGHRVKRLPDTPHKISLGFACGVFASFSPLFGFHFIYAAICAFIVRGNIFAGLLGTFFGNPLTFPFIATVSYQIGLNLIGMEPGHVETAGLKEALVGGISGIWHSLISLVGLSEARWGEVGRFFTHVFWPYYIGGVLPGIAAGVVSYLIARPLVAAYQRRRRAKLFERAAKRRSTILQSQADPAE